MVLLGASAVASMLALGALPPGPGPFSQVVMAQPVPGARRFPGGGKLCDVSTTPFSAHNATNATSALQHAILECGDLPTGGTVLVPAGLVLYTGSLFMRSNLTLRVEGALLGTATGTGDTPASINDAPVVWARRQCQMTDAHAGLINGGRCLRKAPIQSAAHPDGCMECKSGVSHYIYDASHREGCVYIMDTPGQGAS